MCGQLVLGSIRCGDSGQQESRSSQSAVRSITRKWYSGVLWTTAEVRAYRCTDCNFHVPHVPCQCACWNTNPGSVRMVAKVLKTFNSKTVLKMRLMKKQKPPNCAKSDLYLSLVCPVSIPTCRHSCTRVQVEPCLKFIMQM